LKQIALALHNYHDKYGTFPPAYVADAQGRPAHSWRVLILPYLGQEELYRQYRFDEPWNGPHNSRLADQIPEIYRCPSFVKYHQRHKLETAHTRHLTNYVAVIAPDAIFNGPDPVAIDDITDGTDCTLLLIEARHHSVHWMQPDDVTESEIAFDLQAAASDHQANHAGRLQVVLSDGSAKSIRSDSDLSILHALITRNGGEKLDDF
jgi:hypothetical protein